MSLLVITIISLCAIGVVAAIILYVASKKFHVIEDPRIDKVEEALPAANCGGCGFPGCRAFAEATVKADDLGDLYCPVGGSDTMAKVASILGQEVEDKKRQIAVLRCNGACEHRPKTNIYDGATSCSVASLTYGGDTGCEYGCLGMGECVDACNFNAMYMDESTGLPVVIEDNCVACNACVEACPKDLLELRNVGPKSRRIFVSCRNEAKGAIAKKSCEVACIGCSKCFKECKFDAITIANNLAYIDDDKCVLCRKCVPVCPTNAIHELNFPPRREPRKDKAPAKPKIENIEKPIVLKKPKEEVKDNQSTNDIKKEE
ncbi:RnfABCDGE-type electron transport complex B subunit [Balneicella halophila]|uniref:Ion-translocating oxidoreductase complex subunit B n=1 Tax=Balneicella halophila TaxID=1537566 RepID=A0A7L4USB9_BALHA|nr:Fe-S cluster domain-containing protein [Balneicella halophila]PVX52569.1 RnfABCDGE-type electron transport complex B subunit [Balneicella halophila]